MSPAAWISDPGPCANCGAPLSWHAVGNAWVHSDRGHCWCYPEMQGYDQPRATPSKSETKP